MNFSFQCKWFVGSDFIVFDARAQGDPLSTHFCAADFFPLRDLLFRARLEQWHLITVRIIIVRGNQRASAFSVVAERRKVEEPVRGGQNMLTKQANDKWRNISRRAPIPIPILSVRLLLDLPVNPFGCMCPIAHSLIMKIVMKWWIYVWRSIEPWRSGPSFLLPHTRTRTRPNKLFLIYLQSETVSPLSDTIFTIVNFRCSKTFFGLIKRRCKQEHANMHRNRLIHLEFSRREHFDSLAYLLTTLHCDSAAWKLSSFESSGMREMRCARKDGAIFFAVWWKL